MKENSTPKDPLNQDSREFLDGLISGLLNRYKSEWLTSYQIFQKGVKSAEETMATLETRGFIVQKFKKVVETMVQENTEVDLPDFLKDELMMVARVKYDYWSRKGTVLNDVGGAATAKEINSGIRKSGGEIYIFPGYQIALKIKFENSPRPTKVTLLSAQLFKDQYWYDGIYLK